jgi:hypothetical protein
MMRGCLPCASVESSRLHRSSPSMPRHARLMRVGVVPSRRRLHLAVKPKAPLHPPMQAPTASSVQQPTTFQQLLPHAPMDMSHTRLESLNRSSRPMRRWTRRVPRPRAASSSSIMPATVTAARLPRGRIRRPARRSRSCSRCSSSLCSCSASSPSSEDAAVLDAPRKAAGLDPAVLAAFPTVRFEEAASSAPECAVCLSEFDAVRLLTVCRHAFHVVCIDSWLAAHTACPLCRCELDARQRAPGHAAAVHRERDGGRVAIVVDSGGAGAALASRDSGGARSQFNR